MKMLYIIIIAFLLVGGVGLMFLYGKPTTQLLQNLYPLSKSTLSSGTIGDKVNQLDGLIVDWEHTRAGIGSNEFIVTVK